MTEMKLVPVEPTEAMLRDVGVLDVRAEVSYEEARDIWDAMLAAAPSFEPVAWRAKLGSYDIWTLCSYDPTGEKGWHSVEPLYACQQAAISAGEEPVGAAEPQVGRAVYLRIEALMAADPKPATPEWTELNYLSELTSSVEEYGSYDGPASLRSGNEFFRRQQEAASEAALWKAHDEMAASGNGGQDQ